jgi:hypothetical protein
LLTSCYSDPSDRPTAETLLRHSTFCVLDPSYNFCDTALAANFRAMDNTGTHCSPSQGWEDSKLPFEAEKYRNGSEADDATRLSESEVLIEEAVFERNGFEDDVDVLLMQWTTLTVNEVRRYPVGGVC